MREKPQMDTDETRILHAANLQLLAQLRVFRVLRVQFYDQKWDTEDAEDTASDCGDSYELHEETWLRPTLFCVSSVSICGKNGNHERHKTHEKSQFFVYFVYFVVAKPHSLRELGLAFVRNRTTRQRPRDVLRRCATPAILCFDGNHRKPRPNCRGLDNRQTANPPRCTAPDYSMAFADWRRFAITEVTSGDLKISLTSRENSG